MNKQELEVLKDKYAMDTLSQAEYASLEVEILNDPTLENELKNHQDLVKGVQYASELELQDVLDRIHYQQSGVTPAKEQRNIKFHIIAVLLLITTVTAYFLLDKMTNKEVNTNRIYADFYTRYQPSLQDRGTTKDEATTTFNQAYMDGNYQEAVAAIKPFLSESNNDVKITAAIAANETNDLILADSLLNEIITSKDYYFIDHAIWYRTLIKLKSNDTTSIKDMLTPLITNPKADHHDEAKRLLSKLNEL